MSLESKIRYSIQLLQKAEPLALKMSPDGFHLAFSGGKDSQVLYHIAKMAGVKFKAHMQITTIDPPELMRFIRTNYPDVVMHRPEINFYQLIVKKKMLPLRQARYCCAFLKEQAGAGTCTLIGVRAAESIRRAKRSECEIVNHKFTGTFDEFSIFQEQTHACIKGQDKIIISPIFHWTNHNVWNFIRKLNIPYCELYDQGFHRIGCIFCPMADPKIKALERKRYPGVERAIKKSIQTLIDTNNYGKDYNATADELFNWWVSNDSVSKFFAMERYQLKINFEEQEYGQSICTPENRK